jgi:hypothetical protein
MKLKVIPKPKCARNCRKRRVYTHLIIYFDNNYDMLIYHREIKTK